LLNELVQSRRVKSEFAVECRLTIPSAAESGLVPPLNPEKTSVLALRKTLNTRKTTAYFFMTSNKSSCPDVQASECLGVESMRITFMQVDYSSFIAKPPLHQPSIPPITAASRMYSTIPSEEIPFAQCRVIVTGPEWPVVHNMAIFSLAMKNSVFSWP